MHLLHILSDPCGIAALSKVSIRDRGGSVPNMAPLVSDLCIVRGCHWESLPGILCVSSYLTLCFLFNIGIFCVSSLSLIPNISMIYSESESVPSWYYQLSLLDLCISCFWACCNVYFLSYTLHYQFGISQSMKLAVSQVSRAQHAKWWDLPLPMHS